MFWIIGDNTIDRYLGADTHVLVGGNALNVGAQLALHGLPSAYAGAIADDDNGRLVRAALERSGLRADGLVVAPGRTAVTDIRVTDAGDRVFEREEFGVTADYSPDDAVVAAAAAAEWVHIGMLPEAAEAVRRLRAADPRVRVSQDCAVSRGYAGLDVAFGSVGEDVDAGRALARSAREGGAALAVVTLGARGSLAWDGTRWWHQDAAPLSPVDTTGAGDSFIAGFISAYARGAQIGEALSRGAEWAAATCLHRGGWPQD